MGGKNGALNPNDYAHHPDIFLTVIEIKLRGSNGW
jgi:hypothetical protein